MTPDELFTRGLELEDEKPAQALVAYKKIIASGAEQSVAAHINAGTIYYKACNYPSAEKHYRAALEISPTYTLAMFNLGNVLDETGRTQEAIDLYKRALGRDPLYADCRYNLALCYEKAEQPLLALEQWRGYIKIDTKGPWFMHARNQVARYMKKIREVAGLSLIEGGTPRLRTGAPRNPGLFVVGGRVPVVRQPEFFTPDDAA